MTWTLNYANRQHAASFYTVACATYPFVLAALVGLGRRHWTATTGAVCYTALVCLMVWVLPLFAAQPLTGPIHNPLDHLAPPPFPLLLLIPAIGMDAAAKWMAKTRAGDWPRAFALGAIFFLVFLGVQWVFAEFLLTNLADNRLFAGGGKHWPFFLKIDLVARTQFWPSPQDSMHFGNGLMAFALALLASRTGLWFGAWSAKLQR